MEKIKSSLEIALERIGEVKESREELETIEEEKYLKAAASLGNSFLERKTSKEQVWERIHRYPEKIRKKALHIFITRLVEGVTLTNTQEILEAITFLTDNTEITKICMETAGLFKQYLDHLVAKKAEYQKNSRLVWEEKLAREGFRGSALAGLNIKDTEQWQENASQLQSEYEDIIKDFKESIHKRLQSEFN